MFFAQILLGLVLLHSPDGREVWINPREVTTMHSSIPGQANRNVTEGARCVLNTTDGKFLSVKETCAEVRDLFRKR